MSVDLLDFRHAYDIGIDSWQTGMSASLRYPNEYCQICGECGETTEYCECNMKRMDESIKQINKLTKEIG